MKSCSIDLGVMEKQVSLRCKYAKPASLYLFARGYFYVLRLPIILHIGVLCSRGCSLQINVYRVWRLREATPLCYLYNALVSSMPNPMKLKQKRSIVTPVFASAGTKAVICPFDIKSSLSFLEKRKCIVSLRKSTPKTNISKCRVVGILYLPSYFISKYSCLYSHELLHCVVLVSLAR